MGAVAPGETSEFEYRPGKSVTIVGATLNTKRELMAQMRILSDPESSFEQKLDAMKAAVPVCCQGLTAEQVGDTMDDQDAMAIIAKVMGFSKASEEEEKKSKSPH